MKTRVFTFRKGKRAALPLAAFLGATIFAQPVFSDRFNAPPREKASKHEEDSSTGLILIPDDGFAALLKKGKGHFDGDGTERAAFVPSRLPSAHSLTDYLPPAEDQGRTQMCVGFSLSYIKSCHEAIEELWDTRLPQHRFSPAAIYSQIPHGPDGGASIVDGLEFLKRTGCTTLSGSSKGRKYRIYDYYAVNPADSTRLKSLLAGGIPIAASVQSVPALHGHRGSGVITTYNATPNDGYHALTVVGYDDRRGSAGAFLVQNSWGTSWGDGRGRGWISYSLFTKICRQAFYAVDAPNDPGR
jgi:Papain family cysteine protease